MKIDELKKLIEDYNCYYIFRTQKLTWKNIKYLADNYIDKIDFDYIFRTQKLTWKNIKYLADNYTDKIDFDYISKYQKLSKQLIKKYNLQILETCWIYKTKQFMLNYLKQNTDDYKIVNDEYIVAYKSVNKDYTSVYNNRIQYKIGKSYTAHCDCNIDEENSFGLSAWTREGALDYHSEGKLLLVKIYIKDIAAIIHDNNKIRCRKLTVIKEIKE